MEFRKMVMITLYAKQKKRHRCTEQNFGLCGRRRGWDVWWARFWKIIQYLSGTLVLRASLLAQTVKHLPAMQETWVQSLGWEDPLEKEMASHSSTLAWKIPWMEEPVHVVTKSWTRLSDFTFFHFSLGEAACDKGHIFYSMMIIH